MYIDSSNFASIIIQSNVWKYFFQKVEFLNSDKYFRRNLIVSTDSTTLQQILIVSQIFFLTKEEINFLIFDFLFCLNDFATLNSDKLIKTRAIYEHIRFRIIDSFQFLRVSISIFLILFLKFHFFEMKENFIDFKELNLNLNFFLSLIQIFNNFILKKLKTIYL